MLISSALQGFDHLFGEVWQFGDIFVTAGDGADLEFFPVLGQIRIRSGGRDLVLDLVLALEDAPGQGLLEPLQFLLDELLGPDRALLAPLHALVHLVDGGRLVAAAVGRAQVHRPLHRPQVALVHLVDERLDGGLHAGLSLFRHVALDRLITLIITFFE